MGMKSNMEPIKTALSFEGWAGEKAIQPVTVYSNFVLGLNKEICTDYILHS